MDVTLGRPTRSSERAVCAEGAAVHNCSSPGNLHCDEEYYYGNNKNVAFSGWVPNI